MDKNSNDNNNGNKEKKTGDSRTPSILWVIFVLLFGGFIGLLSYVYAYTTFPRFVVGLNPFGPSFGFNTALEYHSILSTVSIALLVSLLFVYARIYTQTRANFILGLFIVLLALLLQNLLQYPLLHPFIDNTPLEVAGFSSPVSDIFTIIAYTVFLYLSLE